MRNPFTPRVVTACTMALLAVVLIASAPSHAGVLDLIGLGHAKSDKTTAAAVSATGEIVSNETPLAPAPMPNYRAIVAQSGPAVVGITVEGVRHVGLGNFPNGEPDNDPFFQFFRGLPGFSFRLPPSAEQPFKGQGSGFVISSDGLILTNAHVVRDAQEVNVKFADRREMKAKVLGADPASDLAVLRVNAHNLPTVKLGDPKNLQVGDYVLAIGAPFGFDESATAGIVSAKGRSLPGESYTPFIQTDAAVNPGNSGGPLFDANGYVVGINAQIYSQTGGYQGLSFAIPIDVALKAKDQIVATGHASHARLGVMVQDLNQDLADSFGLSRPDGALVASVEPDSPAARAGLQPGDVITRVDATPVLRAGDLSAQIGMDTPGKQVELKVWRNHASRDMKIELGSATPGRFEQAAADAPGQAGLGLSLRPLTRDERKAASVDHGLIVESASGPAARAGITEGDVVLGIDGQPARSVEQLRNILSTHPKTVALLIDRDGQKIFVPVNLG
jgi:serine protease Do